VLVPGAYLLAFGGSRTHHRLMCAIEDAGFEVCDCMMWLYGQGFPKSLDIQKAMDTQDGVEGEILNSREEHNFCRPEGGGDERLMTSAGSRETRTIHKRAPGSPESARWNGYGTALKPAWEPIIVAMKPTTGTFVDNARKWGVAGINIEAGRIPVDDEDYARNCSGDRGRDQNRTRRMEFGMTAGSASDGGRWPANVILDEEAGALLDEQSGVLTSGANPSKRNSDKTRAIFGRFAGQRTCDPARGADTGGASRFFYCAKANRKEREGNEHPTVKPIGLAEYLARLILPPAGRTRRLLTPYSGSGSEMIGALRAGWDESVGIENDPKWCDVARQRIARSLDGNL
jgi:site-specific DNA-methyltransferase (adenine-specific)